MTLSALQQQIHLDGDGLMSLGMVRERSRRAVLSRGRAWGASSNSRATRVRPSPGSSSSGGAGRGAYAHARTHAPARSRPPAPAPQEEFLKQLCASTSLEANTELPSLLRTVSWAPAGLLSEELPSDHAAALPPLPPLAPHEHQHHGLPPQQLLPSGLGAMRVEEVYQMVTGGPSELEAGGSKVGGARGACARWAACAACCVTRPPTPPPPLPSTGAGRDPLPTAGGGGRALSAA